jgi:hypothetical protein
MGQVLWAHIEQTALSSIGTSSSRHPTGICDWIFRSIFPRRQYLGLVCLPHRQIQEPRNGIWRPPFLTMMEEMLLLGLSVTR